MEKQKQIMLKCVDIATTAAINKMVLPGALAVFTPIIFGLVLGQKEMLGWYIGWSYSNWSFVSNLSCQMLVDHGIMQKNTLNLDIMAEKEVQHIKLQWLVIQLGTLLKILRDHH